MNRFESSLGSSCELSPKNNTFLSLLDRARELPVDAIVVHSGSIKKIKTSPDGNAEVTAGTDITDEDYLPVPEADVAAVSVRYSSTGYNDARSGWGKAKDIAAIEQVKSLKEIQEQAPVIVTSSRAPNNKSSVSDAEVTADFLQRRGVENEMVLQSSSIDTFTELLEALRLAQEKGWQHIAFTVTETQRRRAEAMLYSLTHMQDEGERRKVESSLADNANRFNRQKFPDRAVDLDHARKSYEFLLGNPPHVTVSFVSAEDALSHRDPRYAAMIQELRKTGDYQAKLKTDENDSSRWVSGDYTKRGLPFVDDWKNRTI